MNQPGKLPIRLERTRFSLLFALLLMLSACNTATPQAPTLEATTEGAGFAFHVDPRNETVIPVASEAAPLQAQAGQNGRLLVQGEDIRYQDFSFEFRSPNSLVVRLRVKNITDTLDFTQPFFFTLSSTSTNVVEATAPLVTDEKLGGDGVLSPEETSERFRFKVTFKEDEPFTFFVDANAVPVEVNQAPVAGFDFVLEDGAIFFFAANASSDPDGDPLSYSWDFGDGSSATVPFFEKEYAEAGEYTVTLTVSDGRGGQDSVSQTVTVQGPENCVSPVDIPDATLARTIRSQLGQPERALTCESLALLTEIQAVGVSIVDLEGLQYASNLTTLNLLSNDISDLSPLAELTQLTDIDLAGNKIRDLSPLEGLINLEVLALDDNEISDISALVRNSGLGAGDDVDLYINPLNPQAKNDAETLIARGVDVFY